MSPGGLVKRIVVPGFPRVSGDEPLPLILNAGVQMFSPRERG